MGTGLGWRHELVTTMRSDGRSRRIGILMWVTIIIVIMVLWGMFLIPNYEMSIVSNVGNVAYTSFSPLEIGHSFVYGGGYLAIPHVGTEAVGVTVSF